MNSPEQADDEYLGIPQTLCLTLRPQLYASPAIGIAFFLLLASNSVKEPVNLVFFYGGAFFMAIGCLGFLGSVVLLLFRR